MNKLTKFLVFGVHFLSAAEFVRIVALTLISLVKSLSQG